MANLTGSARLPDPGPALVGAEDADGQPAVPPRPCRGAGGRRRARRRARRQPGRALRPQARLLRSSPVDPAGLRSRPADGDRSRSCARRSPSPARAGVATPTLDAIEAFDGFAGRGQGPVQRPEFCHHSRCEMRSVRAFRRCSKIKSVREETMKAQRGRLALLAAMAVLASAVPAHGPEARRRAQDRAHGQSAERLDPRGGDGVGRRCRSCRSTTTSSCSISTCPRTACSRSCPTSPPSGNGRTAAPSWSSRTREGVKWHDGKPFTAKDVGLHLRPAAERREQAAPQPACGVVEQCREGDGRRATPR